MTPVFFLTLPWAMGRGTTGRLLLLLLYLCYYLPGMAFLPTVTHVQVSVVALAVLTLFLVRLAGRESPGGKAMA
jgi:hypothetical protein